jgi:hypothetical protein
LAFHDNTDADANISFKLETSDLGAALIPILGYSTESIASLRYLQALFRDDLSLENLLLLITSQYSLNQKQ